MGSEQLNALVYVRAGTLAAHKMAVNGRLVERRSWNLVGVTFDPDGGRWAEAVRMWRDGTVDIIVVHDRGELPADWAPRVEVAVEQPTVDIMPQPRSPEQRRPSPRARRLPG